MLTLTVMVLCPPSARIVPYLAGPVTIASTTVSRHVTPDRRQPGQSAARVSPKDRSGFTHNSPKDRNPKWVIRRLSP